MTKVGLLTTWNEKCGIAEYAANLVEYCKDANFTIIPHNTPIGRVNTIMQNLDVLCWNYEPGLFPYPDPKTTSLCGKPTVLILHTSHEGDNRNEFTNSFTRVVVHEKTTEGFTYIPMGIPNCDIKDDYVYKTIGTFGIPFNKKGFHQIALAAEFLKMKACFIAPATRHYNTEIMKACVREANPECQYVTDWKPKDEVVQILSQNLVNVFAYNGNDSGISAAVRLGLAARRPIVLTRDRQFNDLFDYEDEIEFVDQCTPEAIAIGINRVLTNMKVPNRVCEDMSWVKVGGMYKNLFEEIAK